jgi:hypothetical protein
MDARMRTFLVNTSSAIAVAALVALLFTFGVPGAVHANDPPVARPDMILVSATGLEGLEQRVSYLEGVVASLTESSQHVSRQLCVSDDSGAETCVTKGELDALLASHAPVAEAAQSASLTGAEAAPAAKEPPAAEEPPAAKEELAAKEEPIATAASNPEPSRSAGPSEIAHSEPETTGSISAAAPPAAEPGAPAEIETLRSDELP